jgi:hypothetical protein
MIDERRLRMHRLACVVLMLAAVAMAMLAIVAVPPLLQSDLTPIRGDNPSSHVTGQIESAGTVR